MTPQSQRKFNPKCVVDKDNWNDSAKVGLRWKGLWAEPVKFVEKVEGTSAPVMLTLTRADVEDYNDPLQAMLDALWDAGYRPTNHRDVTQELQATKYHLEDMRDLVGLKKC